MSGVSTGEYGFYPVGVWVVASKEAAVVAGTAARFVNAFREGSCVRFFN